MASRYGRKKRRAHRAKVAELERRALDMAQRYQQLLRGRDQELWDARSALRNLATDEAKRHMAVAVQELSDEFMRRAVLEIGASGVNLMQVYAQAKAPIAMVPADTVQIFYTVMIPEIVWRFSAEVSDGG
ncbi:MAG TPA: hypothetical protein PLR41_20160 [Alphaproteobacteria bacterium]|nr:hypothetical protein [Alphaproteobacteria bacterium]